MNNLEIGTRVSVTGFVVKIGSGMSGIHKLHKEKGVVVESPYLPGFGDYLAVRFDRDPGPVPQKDNYWVYYKNVRRLVPQKVKYFWVRKEWLLDCTVGNKQHNKLLRSSLPIDIDAEFVRCKVVKCL
jgi:hypothetical protein